MRFAAARNSDPALFQKIRLPGPGGKILVAVSGGLDSMVLLHILERLCAARRWKLTVAHFNHCLRGHASDADEAFVRKMAAQMKLPFVAGRAQVKKLACDLKFSIEMAARKMRHEFLARTARERKIKTIALAHHADDQMELFFLRLLRGTGGSGLGGMKWRSLSPVDRRISLLRPLLDVSRAELEQFVRENKIRYCVDATNLSVDFLRNRIRHELLPLLRKRYQPALSKIVLRLMEIVGAESDLLSEMAQEWIGAKSGRKDFGKLPDPVQRQVLRLQLVGLGITTDFDLIESLRKTPNRPVSAGGNVFVFRDKEGRVAIHKHSITEFDDKRLVASITEPGTAVFDCVKFEWEFGERQMRPGAFAQAPSKPGMEYFDADNAGGEIILRHWCAGDRFQPIGMKSAVKLQDLFTNLKIPREQRHKLVIAEADGEIFWVEGLRISENFKLTPKTKHVLIWRWRR